MPTDYFTVAEYLEFAKDPQAKNAGRTDILRAQAEVIQQLETWAQSAWPNVGVVVGVGGMLSGAATVTLTSGTFQPEDKGKQVKVPGAGPNDLGGNPTDLVATIVNEPAEDDTQATLSANAAHTVTAVTVVWGDGEGTALAARTATQKFDSHVMKGVFTAAVQAMGTFGVPGESVFAPDNVPILAVSSVQYLGTEVDPSDYVLYADEGLIRFINPVMPGFQVLAVTYSYGHLVCPPAVKWPCIQATESRLKWSEKRGKIPRNTQQFTSEGTTIVLRTPNQVGPQPWPWDAAACDAIQSLWGADRPHGFVTV